MSQTIRASQPLPPGKTLDSILAEGPLDLDRLKAIALGVLDALDHAHRTGIPHGPLRPETVYVADDDSVKLADFHLEPVEPPDAAADPGAVAGRLYEPPEPRDDVHRDLYALGVILYQGVAGLSPADDRGPIAVAREHFIKTATPPSALEGTIPADWDGLVVRALGEASRGGFRDVAEMRAALSTLSTERIPMPEVSFPEPASESVPDGMWSIPAALQVDIAPLAAESPVDVLRRWEPEPAIKNRRRGIRTVLLVVAALGVLGLAAGVAAFLLMHPGNTLADIIPFQAHSKAPVPAVPAPTSPENGAIVSKTAVRFCWTPVPEASRYLLRLTPGVSHRERNSCATIALRPATYSWTVAAIAGGTPAQAGPASEGRRFTVLAAPTPTSKPAATSTPKPTATRKSRPAAHPTSAPAAVAPVPTPTPIPVQAAPPAYVAPPQAPAPVVQAPAPAPTPAPAPAPAAPSAPRQGSGSNSGTSCIPFVNC